jgi:hypothetical protein
MQFAVNLDWSNEKRRQNWWHKVASYSGKGQYKLPHFLPKLPITTSIRTTAGVVMPPGVRSAGKLSPNGCGTSAWNWAMRLIPRPSARRSLLLLASLRTRRLPTPLPPHRGMDREMWPCPGNAAASLVTTLPPSRMERCAAPLGSHSLRKSGAEKPMEACAWCMREATAVAAPVPCGSSLRYCIESRMASTYVSDSRPFSKRPDDL